MLRTKQFHIKFLQILFVSFLQIAFDKKYRKLASHNNVKIVVESFQNNLHQVERWFEKWKVRLNKIKLVHGTFSHIELNYAEQRQITLSKHYNQQSLIRMFK